MKIEPKFFIDNSDSIFDTYLRVYPGWVEIKKPKTTKYCGTGGALKLGMNMLKLSDAEHIAATFSFEEIERIEIKPATQAVAGIIQFYLYTNPGQSQANYLNVSFRTDAMNFSYKDNAVANSIKNYFDEARKKGFTPIIKLRCDEIREISILGTDTKIELWRLSNSAKKVFLKELMRLFDKENWKKHTISDVEAGLKKGTIHHLLIATWDQGVEWGSKGVFYELDSTSFSLISKMIEKNSNPLDLGFDAFLANRGGI